MLWTILIGTLLTVTAVFLPELIPGGAAPNPVGVLLVGLGGTGFVAALQYRIKQLQARLKAQEAHNN